MAHARRKGNPTWSSDLAYAVGLIVADGCLSSNGRHIDFTSKDLDQILTFQRCLGITHIAIGTKNSGTPNRSAYRVQFGDVVLYEWLVSVGVTPRKSLTIQKVDVPDALFFDFLRGEWDGDGTIYATRDKRWAHAVIVSLGFASGSVSFLQWLRASINARLGTTGHVYQSEHASQLRYGRKDSKKVFEAMFYADNLPHLARKFAKAQKIFRMCGL